MPRRLGRPKVPNASRGDLEGDGAVKAHYRKPPPQKDLPQVEVCRCE